MRRLSSLLLFCCFASAQSLQPLSGAAAQDEPTTFTAETRWVILPISVSDKNGKLITDLQRKSFKVLANSSGTKTFPSRSASSSTTAAA